MAAVSRLNNTNFDKLEAMDRRKSLKVMILGSVSAGILLDACKSPENGKLLKEAVLDEAGIPRMMEETKHFNEVTSYTYFTDEEMKTITLLADIIIPKDDVSGSASDAKVPEFIEFIVKDMPEHQLPMRGGLRWLDMQCLNRFDHSFVDCNREQQMEVVDEIAWPARAKEDMRPGVKFFSLMRNLTASGFYTTAIGVKDIGYLGNTPTVWTGVPDEVLKQYGLAYTEKELKECV